MAFIVATLRGCQIGTQPYLMAMKPSLTEGSDRQLRQTWLQSRKATQPLPVI